MSSREKVEASQKICDRIRNLPEFQSAKTVFAFLPLSSEPDIEPLFDSSVVWGFPRLINREEMEFLAVSQVEKQTLAGDFNIREPDPYRCHMLPVSAADLILIPGVGFSEQSGHRLGRGKGHYDRYLSQFEELEWRPLLVGICYTAQLCDVPPEEHDIPVDLVITERS